MGLLTGNLSFRRFKVIGEVPGDFRDRFVEDVRRRAFRENLDARTADDNIGWVNIADPDDADFDLNKVVYNQYLVLGLRVDRKRVPARLLTILARRRQAEVREAKGIERLSANHRREIKEAVEEDMLQRALPTVQVHDMAWDLDAGEVRFFSTSDAVADLFRVYFKDTFGLDLARLRLSHMVEDRGMSREEIAKQAWALRPDLAYGA